MRLRLMNIGRILLIGHTIGESTIYGDCMSLAPGLEAGTTMVTVVQLHPIDEDLRDKCRVRNVALLTLRGEVKVVEPAVDDLLTWTIMGRMGDADVSLLCTPHQHESIWPDADLLCTDAKPSVRDAARKLSILRWERVALRRRAMLLPEQDKERAHLVVLLGAIDQQVAALEKIVKSHDDLVRR